MAGQTSADIFWVLNGVIHASGGGEANFVDGGADFQQGLDGGLRQLDKGQCGNFGQ